MASKEKNEMDQMFQKNKEELAFMKAKLDKLTQLMMDRDQSAANKSRKKDNNNRNNIRNNSSDDYEDDYDEDDMYEQKKAQKNINKQKIEKKERFGTKNLNGESSIDHNSSLDGSPRKEAIINSTIKITTSKGKNPIEQFHESRQHQASKNSKNISTARDGEVGITSRLSTEQEATINTQNNPNQSISRVGTLKRNTDNQQSQ